jgi:ABC-type uncharacterized transport system fused permease/ATPase subunit
MNLILFGYRGCGKTTLGKKLAAQLWKDFVDGDQQVCKPMANPLFAPPKPRSPPNLSSVTTMSSPWVAAP